MEKADIKSLRKYKFVKCTIIPHNGGPDDGLRVFVKETLPAYLNVKEVLDADGLNLVLARTGQAEWDAEVLYRFLIPCAAECDSLCDEIYAGCNTLHIAARNPEIYVAELKVLGARVCSSVRHFSAVEDFTELFLYSDGSLLLKNYPSERFPSETFKNIPNFIDRHAENIADAAIGSAMQAFRLYCAEFHIECWFEAFLPKRS